MNDKVIIIILAVLLDGVLGDPPNVLHPVAAMGWVIRTLDHWIGERSQKILFWGGISIVVICMVVFWLIPFAIISFLTQYPILSILIQSVLLKLVFSMRRLLLAGREVEIELRHGDIQKARKSVATNLVSRDTNELNGGYVASAAIESLAENFSDSFVAPLMMFVIGGLPLAWVYRSINTADAMIGYRVGRYECLGKATARLDDLLNWLPARISALAIVVSSAILSIIKRQSYHAHKACLVMRKQHSCTSSPNAGYPMSAAAGALGINLEKKGEYLLCGGNHLPEHRHIADARLLIGISSFLFCVFSVVITYVLGRM